jgi:hypothetical protein
MSYTSGNALHFVRSPESAQVLIDKGVNPKILHRYRTIIQSALKYNRFDLAIFYATKYPELIEIRDKNGFDSIEYARFYGCKIK